MKMIEKIKLCEKCGGTGKLKSFERWGPHEKWINEECPNCEGTGRLNMKITIDCKPYVDGKKLSNILTDKLTEEKR